VLFPDHLPRGERTKPPQGVALAGVVFGSSFLFRNLFCFKLNSSERSEVFFESKRSALVKIKISEHSEVIGVPSETPAGLVPIEENREFKKN
jgi:hypothetical protein